MATQLQIRRGTSTQVAAFTGAEGEIVVNTTNDSVHVNDGSTAGGFEMARADLNNVSDTSLNAALTGNTVSALTITTLTLGATAITATGTELNLLDGVTATTAELNYVDGVTSAIQTQIDTKAPLASPTFTGTVTAAGLTVDTSDQVIINHSADGGGIRIDSTNATNTGSLRFGDVADNYIGAVEYNHTNDSMSFYANNSTRMTIGSSGNVGIGTTSPTRALSVFGDTAGVISITSNSTDGISSLAFGDTADDNAGRVNYLNASNSMAFYTDAAERLRIDSSGKIGIGTSSPTSAYSEPALHIHAAVNGAEIHLTDGSTGATATDGLSVFQYGTDGYIWERESGNLRFGTAATERLRIDSLGGIRAGTGARFLAASTGVSAPDYSFSSDGGMGMYRVPGSLCFSTGSTERMRIDASGNLLVGTTDNNPTTGTSEGIVLGAGGIMLASNTSDAAMALNRTSTNGDIAIFKKDGTTVGRLSNDNTYFFIAGGASGGTHSGLRFVNNSSIRPCTASGANSNNVVAFGATTARWTVIYATTGTINTSDRREKQDIEALSDAEQRVAVAAKGLLRKFRWIDAVEAKGDDARIHFGIIAQDLQDAFTAEGLDAGRYAMFCSDTFWIDTEGESYETQEEAPEGATEQTRLGVRYSELLAFIISAI